MGVILAPVTQTQGSEPSTHLIRACVGLAQMNIISGTATTTTTVTSTTTSQPQQENVLSIAFVFFFFRFELYAKHTKSLSNCLQYKYTRSGRRTKVLQVQQPEIVEEVCKGCKIFNFFIISL